MHAALPAILVLGLGCCDHRCGHPKPCNDSFNYVHDTPAHEFGARITASKFGSVSTGTTEKAIREIDGSVERLAAHWNMLCRDWNHGAIDQAEFQSETQAIRTKIDRLDELTMILGMASDEASFQLALREAYQMMMADRSGTVDLALQFGVAAQRSGDAEFEVVADGAALPTGTKLELTVNTNAPAYLYMYQVDSSGGISVLFPDPLVAVSNPLPAGTDLVVPQSSAFTLADTNIGTEQIHVVASTKPMPQLDSTLAVTAADPRAVTAAQLDCESARGLEYEPVDGCPKRRGLDFVSESGVSDYSLEAVNAAGDDAVHIIYTFEHVAG